MEEGMNSTWLIFLSVHGKSKIKGDDFYLAAHR